MNCSKPNLKIISVMADSSDSCCERFCSFLRRSSRRKRLEDSCLNNSNLPPKDTVTNSNKNNDQTISNLKRLRKMSRAYDPDECLPDPVTLRHRPSDIMRRVEVVEEFKSQNVASILKNNEMPESIKATNSDNKKVQFDASSSSEEDTRKRKPDARLGIVDGSFGELLSVEKSTTCDEPLSQSEKNEYQKYGQHETDD
ncbi:hypothetical protein Ciccas_007365 [Cichlidogyrus casuarinus]|uniref:Uncharacterized protein n=1 Tax=Cichlidogyrus casuarinus TaxID=1844966 RepID=A0ABD2Q338_9PLAT